MGLIFLEKGSIRANTLNTGKRYRSWIRVGSMKKLKKSIKAAKRIGNSSDLLRRLCRTYRVKAATVPNMIHPAVNRTCVSGCRRPPRAHMLNAFTVFSL